MIAEGRLDVHMIYPGALGDTQSSHILIALAGINRDPHTWVMFGVI